MGETQKHSEISLVYIFKLLLSKLKWLVLITLIGVFVGAGAGVLKTYDKKYYGTTIKYFVNPTGKTTTNDDISNFGLYGTYDKPIMDAIVTVLSQQHFSTMMALSKTDDLYIYIPEKGSDAELNALIDTANTTREAYFAKADALTALHKQYEAADAAEKVALLSQIATAETEKADAKTEAITAQNKLYEVWTQTEAFHTFVNRINTSVTFSNITQEDSAYSRTIALPFIYVNISVLNDEAFAELLYTFVSISVPPFVMENMWKPGEYTETKCDRMNIFDTVSQTNQGETISTAVKYGVLLGVAALFISCLIFIYIDLADKRLRNIDQVSEDLQIPLLGVIPTILVEQTEQQTEKEAKV